MPVPFKAWNGESVTLHTVSWKTPEVASVSHSSTVLDVSPWRSASMQILWSQIQISFGLGWKAIQAYASDQRHG